MSVTTHMQYFLCNPMLAHEKPYIAAFPVDNIPGAAPTNYALVPKETQVHDLRTRPRPDINKEGFTYINRSTQLSYDDFTSDSNIRNKYFEEITAAIRELYPHYQEIVYVDHQIRKRSHLYEATATTQLEPRQPCNNPHVDFTPYGAALKIRGSLSDKPAFAEKVLKKDYDVLNVWRLLCRETPDWPLAFCDARSVNEEDAVETDVVYENAHGEMYLLRHSPEHQWFFLRDQTLDEVWLWRNADAHGTRPKAFHTSFDNPLVDENSPLRQSIEVRLAAFF